jgi:soluble lytic murein transglycosylase-like protein
MVRLAVPALILLLSVSSAHASVEVTFVGGRTLVVQSIEIANGRATLTLQGGGTLTIEAGRIKATATLPDPQLAAAQPASEGTDPIGAPPPGSPGSLEAAPAPPPLTAVEPPAPIPPAADPIGEGRSASPAGSADYNRLIEEAARRRGVDPELLRCLIVVESGLDPNAVSPKGAQGLAQLMPATARELQVADPFDPVQAIDGAARRLHDLLERSGGKFVPALAAYNAGSGAVARWGGLPPYRETIAYIERILTLYAAK